MDRLEYCIENHAVLIKWIPAVQKINPIDENIAPFFQRLSKAEIPLLVHVGGEKTFRTVARELDDVDRLIPALDAGVKIIAAHSGTWPRGDKKSNQMPRLRELLKRYQNLWLDNSGICNPSRYFHLPKIAKDKLLSSRTLYGSDWPVPSNAFYYWRQLGIKDIWSLESISNPLERDMAIKARFGYPESSFYRAQEVLANLDKWLEPEGVQPTFDKNLPPGYSIHRKPDASREGIH